jgi:hypothetical protein
MKPNLVALMYLKWKVQTDHMSAVYHPYHVR